MKYMRLLSQAVVVPEQVKGRPFWMPQGLGSGSVVGVMQNTKPSPITGRRDEVYVKWLDVAGRETFGWLAKATPMDRKVKEKKLLRTSTDDKFTPWDTLRYQMCANDGWDTIRWIGEFGRLKVPLIHAVIRELGGRVPKGDSVGEAGAKVLKLITGKDFPESIMKTTKKSTKKQHEVESTEAHEKEAKVSAKKAGKKSGKKESAKKGSKRSRPEGAGRTSAMSGKVIVRKVKDNPRREGSRGYTNWKLYKKGMTYEQFLAAGGHRGCLAKDVEKGHVKLVSKK